MKIDSNDTQEGTCISIGNSLTIHQASLYYQKWSKFLGLKKLKIDASEINEVDGAGMQLLIYIVNRVCLNNGSIQWVPNPSQYFIDNAQQAGMMKALLLNKGETK